MADTMETRKEIKRISRQLRQNRNILNMLFVLIIASGAAICLGYRQFIPALIVELLLSYAFVYMNFSMTRNRDHLKKKLASLACL